MYDGSATSNSLIGINTLTSTVVESPYCNSSLASRYLPLAITPLTVVLPGITPVSVPVESTVTTFVLLLVHVIVVSSVVSGGKISLFINLCSSGINSM